MKNNKEVKHVVVGIRQVGGHDCVDFFRKKRQNELIDRETEICPLQGGM